MSNLGGINLFFRTVARSFAVLVFVSSYFNSLLLLTCFQVQGNHHGSVWGSTQTRNFEELLGGRFSIAHLRAYPKPRTDDYEVNPYLLEILHTRIILAGEDDMDDPYGHLHYFNDM
jgi:hypothetical protein